MKNGGKALSGRAWLQFGGGDRGALMELGENILIKPCFADVADDIEIEIKKKKKKNKNKNKKSEP